MVHGRFHPVVRPRARPFRSCLRRSASVKRTPCTEGMPTKLLAVWGGCAAAALCTSRFACGAACSRTPTGRCPYRPPSACASTGTLAVTPTARSAPPETEQRSTPGPRSRESSASCRLGCLRIKPPLSPRANTRINGRTQQPALALYGSRTVAS